MKLTKADLEKSLELASKATPKFYTSHPKMEHYSDYLIGVDCCDEEPFVIADMNRHMDKWKFDLEFIAHHNPEFVKALVQAHREGLKALEFYANPDPITGYFSDEGPYTFFDGHSDTTDTYFGRRAREFLSKHGGDE